jgi:hypothetical protein
MLKTDKHTKNNFVKITRHTWIALSKENDLKRETQSENVLQTMKD